MLDQKATQVLFLTTEQPLFQRNDILHVFFVEALAPVYPLSKCTTCAIIRVGLQPKLLIP
jgi:hypothetical protein